MKLIAKRYIDLYAPGAEIGSGRYDDATLRSLLNKGHVAIVDDEEPATAALVIERIPEAESDTVTRVYDGSDETKSPEARAEALAEEPEKSAKIAKRPAPKK